MVLWLRFGGIQKKHFEVFIIMYNLKIEENEWDLQKKINTYFLSKKKAKSKKKASV